MMKAFKFVCGYAVTLAIWPLATFFFWFAHRNTFGVAFEKWGEYQYFYVGKCGSQTKEMRKDLKEFFKLNQIHPKTKERLWSKWYGVYWTEEKDWAWQMRETMNNEMGIPISTSCRIGPLSGMNITEVGGP